MVQLSSILMLVVAIASADAAPTFLQKRIAQNIPESTQKWEQACRAAGGGLQCNPISVAAFSTLLAAPGPCEQQDAADKMVDLAKQLANNAEMIKLAQIFVQQPRNTPTSLSTPYCQKAPRNAELRGLFQCQFQTANLRTFVGNVAVGGAGTVPFGMQSLSPLGSCPANPTGPIPDGVQLNTLTQNPGRGVVVGGGNNGAGNVAPVVTSTRPAATSPAAPKPPVNPPPAAGGNNAGAGGFKAQNGRDAQALNTKFSTLNANSACTSGENACIGTSFAQCANGKFVTFSCGGGLSCFALPLVNSRGTSITCTTEADAAARITASGATGGVRGGSAVAPAPTPVAPPATTRAAANPPAATRPAAQPAAPAAGNFKAQNGRDAQALNSKFTSLNTSSACTSGENVCLANGSFAQCANGKFVSFACGGGLKCFALPLVNSRGTSVTCTTEADAIARIAASGATGGLRG